MLRFILLVVFPLVCHARVLRLTMTKPDAMDNNFKNSLYESLIVCADKFIIQCHSLKDNYGRPKNLEWYFPNEQIQERQWVEASSVGMIYKHQPCTSQEVPKLAEELAYMFMDSCESGFGDINVTDTDAEAKIKTNEWDFCSNKVCTVKAQRSLTTITWRQPMS